LVNHNDNHPPIPLSEVPEEWLRAWRDAGYMSKSEYEAELARRKPVERKRGLEAISLPPKP
jgi:hypothetical protein